MWRKCDSLIVFSICGYEALEGERVNMYTTMRMKKVASQIRGRISLVLGGQGEVRVNIGVGTAKFRFCMKLIYQDVLANKRLIKHRMFYYIGWFV